MGDDPNHRQLAALDVHGGREQPAPPRHRLDRPLPGPPARSDGTDLEETLGALTDLVRAGQDPLLRLARPIPPRRSSRRSGSPSGAACERFVCEQPPYSILGAGIEADVLPACEKLRHGGDPVEPARRRLAHRPLPQGPGGRRRAAPSAPRRFDLSSREPDQARSRRALGAARRRRRHLDDRHGAGLRARHPAVTSPIIGPRTMEQLESQLGAADVHARRRRAGPHRRDRPARVNVNQADAGWTNPALAPAARRR